jgi:hypothetical protein
MLPLVQIYGPLRGRGRRDVRHPIAFAEPPEEVSTIFREVRRGLRQLTVGVVHFHAGFPVRHRRSLAVIPGSNGLNQTVTGGTNFLLLLSVTMHSTWSSRQFVQGEPFSTTSQRTFRARQQQHALDARRFTGRALAERPAVEALRFPFESESTELVGAAVGVDEVARSDMVACSITRAYGE